MSEQRPNNFEFVQRPGNGDQRREVQRPDYSRAVPRPAPVQQTAAVPVYNTSPQPIESAPATEPLNQSQVPQIQPQQQPVIETKKKTKKRINKKVAIIIPLLVVVLAGAGFIGWKIYDSHKSPVPKVVSEGVNFPIYYPQASKLPKGYALLNNSFKVAVKQGVNYTVEYGNNQDIVFSLQPEPSTAELTTFEASYLPLRTAYQTSIGQAEIGAYNLKTLVSLPTNNRTWIVVVAPSNINQSQLNRVLNSLTE